MVLDWMKLRWKGTITIAVPDFSYCSSVHATDYRRNTGHSNYLDGGASKTLAWNIFLQI